MGPGMCRAVREPRRRPSSALLCPPCFRPGFRRAPGHTRKPRRQLRAAARPYQVSAYCRWLLVKVMRVSPACGSPDRGRSGRAEVDRETGTIPGAPVAAAIRCGSRAKNTRSARSGSGREPAALSRAPEKSEDCPRGRPAAAHTSLWRLLRDEAAIDVDDRRSGCVRTASAPRSPGRRRAPGRPSRLREDQRLPASSRIARPGALGGIRLSEERFVVRGLQRARPPASDGRCFGRSVTPAIRLSFQARRCTCQLPSETAPPERRAGRKGRQDEAAHSVRRIGSARAIECALLGLVDDTGARSSTPFSGRSMPRQRTSTSGPQRTTWTQIGGLKPISTSSAAAGDDEADDQDDEDAPGRRRHRRSRRSRPQARQRGASVRKPSNSRPSPQRGQRPRSPVAKGSCGGVGARIFGHSSSPARGDRRARGRSEVSA